jgi:hypothetical protein
MKRTNNKPGERPAKVNDKPGERPARSAAEGGAKVNDMPPVWTPPTRRAFVAMLGLGAAVLATVKVGKRGRFTGTAAAQAPALPTRWIGHC